MVIPEVSVVATQIGDTRDTYGAQRIHGDLAMGTATRCLRKRMARLTHKAGPVGVHGPQLRRATRHSPVEEPALDW